MKRLIKVVVKELGVEDEEVTPNANFIEDLGADDVDIIELVIAIEEEFNVQITDAQFEKMRTVQDAFDTISMIQNTI